MIDKNQIEQWLREGLINQTQAQKMLLDIHGQKEEKKSNKIIIALSIIGSLFLGVGAILFVAANWHYIPNILKTTLLIGSTFGAYFTGYLLKYKLQNLPIIGASLFFLGALLFGASVFLIAQIYNVNADNYTLVLIWLIGILPVAYSFLSIPIAALSVLLSYIFIGLFLVQYLRWFDIHGYTQVTLIPILYLLWGMLLFALGSLHYFFSEFKNFARIYRLAGINTIMLCLFFLSFKFAYAWHYLDYPFIFSLRPLSQFLMLPVGQIIFTGIIVSSMLIIFSSIINVVYNPAKSKTNMLEISLAIIIALSALVCFFVAAPAIFYVLLFNFLLLCLIFSLIIMGYGNEDMPIVAVGMFWLVAFVAGRYFDLFWNFMDRALFFIICGIILVACGIILERKRRQLVGEFKKIKTLAPVELSRKTIVFMLIGIFWFAIIGGYIAIKEHILRTGQEVVLKTVPVDPRDLFRGDYVTLRYVISDIDIKTLPTEKTDFKTGDSLYVELAITDGYAAAARINTEPKKDTLAIRGTVKNVFGDKLSIEYGIESYFVPEGKGKDIERLVGKNIMVKAMIDKSGRAIIKELLVDGKPLSF